ncbi:MAG: hypothetical protein HQ402_03215 [Parcubacteria group bacterium]|nr:hypothetical protein [Parcubacteria group bacterium]
MDKYENENNEIPPNDFKKLSVFIIILSFLFVIYISYYRGDKSNINSSLVGEKSSLPAYSFKDEVVSSQGVELPVIWGDLGSKLVQTGVIDAEKLRSIYPPGVFTDEYTELLLGKTTKRLVINQGNAPFLLNLFWALGLASSNPILDSGEMVDPKYGGAQNFASTGGWTIAQNFSPSLGRVNAMNHYSRHKFFDLTPEQQALVDKVSKGIYRPCCGNSTHFPDCNHGMAMLGLLELMASQGVNEQEMWKTALFVNSYWFPDTYMTIAKYQAKRGIEWKDVNPQEILGANYSSAQGYARIVAQMTEPVERQGGGGCSV